MTRRRIKNLESDLQQVNSFVSLDVSLEQYQTPPRLTAELLSIIDSYNDIDGKSVLDLGCGTGILGLGCVRLGASWVVGIDIDDKAIEVAKQNAEEVGLSPDEITFMVKDVKVLAASEFTRKFDVVVTNPPFGTKKETKLDYEFVWKGLLLGNKVYSLHKSTTREFWTTKVAWNLKLLRQDIPFCIKRTYKFHKEAKKCIKVDFLCHSREPL